MIRKGVVIMGVGSRYDVLSEGEILSCALRGRIRLKGIRSTSPVTVGDIVSCQNDEKSGWVISEIDPRRNYIIRRASNLSKESHIIAANVDQAILLVTLSEPLTALEFIDRFLVTCQAYKVAVTIVISKCDLTAREDIDQFCDIYHKAGYSTIAYSTVTKEGLDKIKTLVANRTTLVAGNSGVGKSTLVKNICPKEDIKIGEISESFHKGKHTTTFSCMYPVAENGYIIDSPGIKGFGLIDIDNTELAHFFPEMISRIQECKFYNCTHTHEPGCSVIKAVKSGEIAFSRYESYLKILDEDGKYRQ